MTEWPIDDQPSCKIRSSTSNDFSFYLWIYVGLLVTPSPCTKYVTLSSWEEHYQFDPDVAVVTTSGYRWRFCTSSCWLCRWRHLHLHWHWCRWRHWLQTHVLPAGGATTYLFICWSFSHRVASLSMWMRTPKNLHTLPTSGDLLCLFTRLKLGKVSQLIERWRGCHIWNTNSSLVPVCEVVDDHVKIFVAQELLVHPAEYEVQLYWMPIMAMLFDPCQPGWLGGATSL